MPAPTATATARLGVHGAIVRALVESRTVQDAGERVLELIGTHAGWQVGSLWEIDERHGLLRSIARWSAPGVRADAFLRASEESTFPPGVGLPGRAWQQLAPVWIPDMAADPGIPRGPLAAECGLVAGLAWPVLGDDGPVGVLEFTAARLDRPDPDAQAFLALLGHQVGLWLQRQSAHVLVRESRDRHAAMVAAALDCVVAMDADGRVVEFNPAAEETFGHAREDAIGRELASLIIPPEFRDAHRNALARYLAGADPVVIGRRLELEGMRADGSRLPVELTVVRLPGRAQALFAGFLRDISDRRAAESERARLLAAEQAARRQAEDERRRAAHIARVLQQSLLPPELPEIPGARAAALFRAEGDTVVGGDFYDVFDCGAATCLVVGDVTGKGPEAAAITALARYTIRAAVMHEDAPSAVLATLNGALLRHGDLKRQCTVAYVTVRPEAGGLAVSASAAGHPLPLIVRAGGEVTPAAAPGTLLGAFDEPQLEDRSSRLEPGDLLVLYTDGVTDVRNAIGVVGTDPLTAVLRECAAEDPAVVVERIRTEIVDREGHQVRDDVAVLAIRAEGG